MMPTILWQLKLLLCAHWNMFFFFFKLASFTFFCCALCTMRNVDKRKIQSTRWLAWEKWLVVLSENSRLMPCSQSVNILLILCFACALNWAHVFLFDRLHFTMMCITAIVFPCAGEGHVLSYSRPVRLTGLLWGIGCHITSISEARAISLKPQGNSGNNK